MGCQDSVHLRSSVPPDTPGSAIFLYFIQIKALYQNRLCGCYGYVSHGFVLLLSCFQYNNFQVLCPIFIPSILLSCFQYRFFVFSCTVYRISLSILLYHFRHRLLGNTVNISSIDNLRVYTPTTSRSGKIWRICSNATSPGRTKHATASIPFPEVQTPPACKIRPVSVLYL